MSSWSIRLGLMWVFLCVKTSLEHVLFPLVIRRHLMARVDWVTRSGRLGGEFRALIGQ
jgi:hypothetical protein